MNFVALTFLLLEISTQYIGKIVIVYLNLSFNEIENTILLNDTFGDQEVPLELESSIDPET